MNGLCLYFTMMFFAQLTWYFKDKTNGNPPFGCVLFAVLAAVMWGTE
jgi:hypothetical protein